jgi:hypothetical protein
MTAIDLTALNPYANDGVSLRKRIEALEKRVADLEKRNAEIVEWAQRELRSLWRGMGSAI